MLLILIPVVWLAVVAVVVAVCQASASAEAPREASDERAYLVREGLVVWDRETALVLRRSLARERRRPAQRPHRTASGRRALHRAHLAAHGRR
jgi:hypothetical protein